MPSGSVAYCLDLRKHWQKYPNAAAALRRHAFHLTGRYSPTEDAARDAWLAENWDLTGMPHTSSETLQAWLKRARFIYSELLKVNGGQRCCTSRREADVQRHFQWFVEVQMLDVSVSELARREKIDRAAVGRETKRIAALFQLQPRRRARGQRAFDDMGESQISR